MTRIRAALLIAVLVSTNFLGILFLIPEDVKATEYISGSIVSDTTWAFANSPYIVVGNVTVEVGANLTIEPGVEVKFNGSYSLIINGTLNATGTYSQPINFTSNQTSPSEGDWLSIRLQSANNTLGYCQISYGDYPLYIVGSNTNNSISNCRIFNNTGDGIYLNDTTYNTLINVTVSFSDGNGITLLSSENNIIKNSTVTQNNGSGIYFNSSGNNNIENTKISYNGQDAIYLEESNESTFSLNTLFYNNGTGINLTSSSSNNTIEINNITSNNQTGILITGDSNSNIISRNNITNNSAVGINITGSIGNQIHHNNFDSNGQNAYDSTNQLNSWDNGVEGNWWSDYTGSDGNGDGIGDTPYDVLGAGSKDWYPLMDSVNISAPIIENTTPNDGSGNVSVNPQISITFSNEMNKTATENATSMSGGVTPSNFTWSNGDQTMTFNPSLTLDSETTYTVNVSTDAKDLLENQLQLDYQFSFTTEDVIGPQITLISPANGTITVAINADVVVTFNETMNTTSVTYTCNPDPVGWTPFWSDGNQTVTYSHNAFDSETTYTFNITGGKDVAGNDLVAGAVPNPWTFTTKDVIGPQINSTFPINNALDVLLSANIVVNFTEEMNTTSVTYTCSPDPLGWSPPSWSNGNQTVTFTHNAFDSETIYTFNITGAKDVAGNDLVVGAVPNPWAFTTEDVIGPQINSTFPINNALNVLISAIIVVNFTEEMNTSSVTYTCIPDPGGWTPSWSNGNQTVTYTHNAFDSETTYSFNITGAKDVAGNDLVASAIPNPWTFTTEDVVGPKISSTTPSNGTINVLITADVIVTFNETMNTSSVTYTCTPDPGGWSVVWSGGNTTATYSHNDFNSTTSYTFEITGAKDLVGNDLVASAIPNPWSFTTEDIVGPEISSTTPSNGTINVLITADVIVTFNETMNTSSVTYSCTPDPGGWTPSWSNGNQTVTYSHNAFDSETMYTFEITGGKDLAGNDLVAGAVLNPWTFTTKDVIPPEITSTSPVNGATDVALSANIVVTYSEEMNTSSVTYACTPDPTGWSVVWSAGNTVATYSHNDFSSTTSYTFEITGGKDLVDYDLVVGAVPNPWSFTTEDVVAPEISSTAPSNGTIDVLITANVVVTFSEEMNTSSVTYTCSPDPGGWSVIWSGGNTQATYSHNPFTSSTNFTFQIKGAKDLAGNDLVAGTVPNPWTFITEDAQAPTIISTSPTNGTSNIGQTANIVVTFSEAMNTSSVIYTCSPNPGGWFPSWSSGDTVATFSHNPFDSYTTYTFQITAGKDLANNSLASGAVPNPWSFTTVETVSPSIIATSPLNGSLDIGLAQNVIVTFSEAMNTSSLSYSCFPDSGGWSISWSSGDTVATFSHIAFSDSTTHQFLIANVKDVAGNNLASGCAPNPWTFTTVDATSPTIIAASPSNASIDIALSADVVVTFSEEMNPATVASLCTPDPGGWSASWNVQNTIATYSHNAFEELTDYTFQIMSGKDIAGNDLVGGSITNPWSFTTEDITAPTITATVPPDGTPNIGLDQDVIVTFSEPMDNTTVTYTCLPDPGGWSVVWNGGKTVATFSHNPFDSSTTYTFQITGGKDLSGSDLAAGGVPNPWSFSTLDTIPPTITLTSPSNGSIDVDLILNVTVTFSEGMNTSSVISICSPDPGGWSLIWSAGDTVATISHDEFDKSTGYTFQIISGKDIAGNNLVAGAVPNPWSFTTVANTPPAIQSVPILTATEDVQYFYDVEAIDSDADMLTYSLTAYPTGMAINSTTGLITWIPTNSQVGANNAVVLVSDGDGGTDSQSFTITVVNVNDLPTITSTPITTATEDVEYTYDVYASDIDGDTLNYSLSTYPTGMAIDKASGLITWTPTNDQVGSNNVYILASDGKGGTDTQSFSIAVSNVNDLPNITSTPITTATEDSLYIYDVEASDIDVSDTLTYSLTAYPTGMMIDADTGVISWTPTNAQVGANPVTVVVSDGNGGTDTQSFTITVTNSNNPPNIFSTPETGATEEVQYTYDADATDLDGDTLTYSLSTYPIGMTIDNASGLIIWTPTNDQVGDNNVVVLVFDGNGGTDTQSFTITVANANDAPTIISTPITTATEDELYVYDVDATDVDEGDILTYSLTAHPTGMMIHATTGVISWTPANAQVGTNSVTVVVSDENGSTATQPFTITVSNANDLPTFTSTPVTTATEDAQYTYDVEATDVDVGDTLSYSLTTSPNGMTIDGATGLILWTPTNDQVGSKNVVVLVSDGNGGNNTQSFTITVANVNDPPSITSTPITTATDDFLYTYDVEASDIDVGDALTYSLTAFPTGMTIDQTTGLIEWTPSDDHVGINSVTVLVLDGNGGNDTQIFSVSVSDTNDPPGIISTALTTAEEDTEYAYDVDALDPDDDILAYSLTTNPNGMTIDSATGLILWTPINDQVGTKNVVVLVLDGNGGTDSQSFTITVANVNDPPTITSTQIITTAEDSLYSYDVDASDVDVGDSLAYSLTASPVGMTIDPATGLITWTPTNDQVGFNEVVVLVSDGNGGNVTQTFSISVSNTNDAPTITSTPITAGTEDTEYTNDVNATDMDIGDTLTYSLTTYPDGMVIDSATGMITWTPTNDHIGANSVTVKVIDGNGSMDTQSFSITVSNVNDPPTITSVPITTATQDTLYTYEIYATDVDVGDTLTYSLTVYPTGMTINSTTGVISWSPTNDQVGGKSVTVEVFDGSGDKDTQSFIITVANVNDPPYFTSQPVTTAAEETEYFYEVEALDIDGDILNYSMLNYPDGMVIDGDAGTISWTPTNDQIGTHTIVVKVIDGNSGEAKQSFTITAENVNDPPAITSTPVSTATEEVVYAYHVQAEDLDLTDDMLTFELAVYPQGMQINSTTGIISWTPTNTQMGDISVIVIVSDGNGGTDTHSFSIIVSNVNDAPIITSTPISTATEKVQYTYDVNAQDIDVGDTLNYSLTSAPEGMSIDVLTGIITWTPTDAQVGSHQIVIKVTDNQSAYATQAFAITVENVNDAPEISDMRVVPETGNNKDRYVFTLIYKDPDGDPGSVKVIINGGEYEMKKVGGDAITGEVYSIEKGLGARNHTYYFEIDDDEGHKIVSNVSKISVSAAEVVDEDEEAFQIPIPEWWIILILLVIIAAILAYVSKVKRQLKRQKRTQSLPQKIENKQIIEHKWEGVGEEEPEESLLDLSK